MSKPRKPQKARSRKAERISLDDALAIAIGAHRQGQTALAVQHYGAILEVAPDHPDALHYLGVARHQQGRHELALDLIGKALALAPDYIDARNNLGNVQKETGRHADAERSYRAVLAARPDFAAAHNNLGIALKEQERYEEAAASYRRALELAPDFAQAWINLGHMQKRTGALHEALTSYRNAIMLRPEDGEAYRGLARSLVAFGRPDEALAVYREWHKIAPDDPTVLHHIAACEGSAPARASDAYVQTTFDRFAGSFDAVLARLDYRAPALCAELLAELLPPPAAALDVLDAGCGTGLCGPLLAPHARRLAGVDLSAGMLAKAAERGGYHVLHEAELTAWLAAHPATYDLVVSADTLCYFGALDAVLGAAAGALRPGGHLVFTVERLDDGNEHRLHPHGRYSHSEAYVRAMLDAAGLRPLAIRDVTLRLESKQPVAGLLVAAAR